VLDAHAREQFFVDFSSNPQVSQARSTSDDFKKGCVRLSSEMSGTALSALSRNEDMQLFVIPPSPLENVEYDRHLARRRGAL
jgi:hypothetical protein